jgi:hypothetical protein
MFNSFARVNTTHEDWKIVDKFDSAYWSGLDAQVYFNNVLINEAIQVSYVVSEQIRPYFGYASYVANRIHHGARIIQGEITMNFKRDGYLFSLLQLIRAQDQNIIRNTPKQAYNPSPEKKMPVSPMNDVLGIDLWEGILTDGLPADVARNMVSKNKILSENAVNSTASPIQTTKGIFETKLYGFDINIIFGSNLNAGRALRWIGADDYSLDSLDASYGDGWVVQNEDGVITSTGIKLVGVSLGGLAKTINDDGRPLVETYSFQARNIEIHREMSSTSSTTTAEALQRRAELKSPVSKTKGEYLNGKMGNNPQPEEYGPRTGDSGYQYT